MKTAEELHKNIAALLKNVGQVSTCKGCGAQMWWVKHNNGKRAPYDIDGTNHFVTCPRANDFRRNKP